MCHIIIIIIMVANTLADSYLPAILLLQQLQLRLQLPGGKSNTLISQPHSHFSRLVLRHWDRSINQLLTSSVSCAQDLLQVPGGAKDRLSIPETVSHVCSDIMQWWCTTAFHQVNCKLLFDEMQEHNRHVYYTCRLTLKSWNMTMLLPLSDNIAEFREHLINGDWRW